MWVESDQADIAMNRQTAPNESESLKRDVQAYWDAHACGASYAAGTELGDRLNAQAKTRYQLEPYIPEFAGFENAFGKDVLEIGVGMGADHHEWAKAKPRSLTGVDLTQAATRFTSQRLALYGLKSNLCQGDAENLPYKDNSFDLIYSWGVLHHSPDTPRAINEVYRVLRPGGIARIMIYHRFSVMGYMLWGRFALAAGRPWRSLTELFACHLESPGTKAYTINEARQMCSRFSHARIRPLLSMGDLLQGNVGERKHRSLLLKVVKVLWPRWLIKAFLQSQGSNLLIELRK